MIQADIILVRLAIGRGRSRGEPAATETAGTATAAETPAGQGSGEPATVVVVVGTSVVVVDVVADVEVLSALVDVVKLNEPSRRATAAVVATTATGAREPWREAAGIPG